MRKFILTAVLTIAIAAPASAQVINLDFPGLADKADEVVDITLDKSMLSMASKFLNDGDDERNIRELVRNLNAIYVRSYTFEHEGEYDRGLAERVKSELGPTWKPLVRVRSKRKENVYVYADMRGEQCNGLVVVSAEPREFTIVSIEGRIDPDRLADLEGQFGIPKMSREKDHE
jgi:hypothetical protein